MPVFFAKEQHVLIQLETEDDWLSFFNSCEGYITLRDFRLIHEYLNQSAKTVVIEKAMWMPIIGIRILISFPESLLSIQARQSGQISSLIKYPPRCCLNLTGFRMNISAL
ncbi:MAG: hypothetical protein LWX54_05100 [Deltaproteobacteria bacterium]|jgi:hypothetical protein|nr:hypothetical protein [Deltaproteobacteria bacterium]